MEHSIVYMSLSKLDNNRKKKEDCLQCNGLTLTGC